MDSVDAGKSPLRAGDHGARAVGRVAHGENVARVGGVRGLIFGAADTADDDVPEGPILGCDDGSKVVAEEPGDGLALVGGDRCVEAEISRKCGRVPLPAEVSDGVALIEEPVVAEVFGGGGESCAGASVDEAHEAFGTAVGDFEQERVIAAVEGAEEEEVGGEFDFAVCVARSFVEVDDDTVVRIAGADGVVDARGDFLVRASSAEGLVVEYRLAGENFDAGDAGVCGERGGESEEQGGETGFHWKTV